MEPFSAGIVPYIIVDKILYFLLGLEKSRNNWSGFVGSCENGEQIMDTAIREFHEETAMIFEKYTPFILNQLERIPPFMDKSSSGKNVYIYIVEFPVDCQEMIKDFINSKAKLNDPCCHEKSIVRWFTIDEIEKSNKIFYRLKKLILSEFSNNYISSKST